VWDRTNLAFSALAEASTRNEESTSSVRMLVSGVPPLHLSESQAIDSTDVPYSQAVHLEEASGGSDSKAVGKEKLPKESKLCELFRAIPKQRTRACVIQRIRCDDLDTTHYASTCGG
jgi:hypothetical protein